MSTSTDTANTLAASAPSAAVFATESAVQVSDADVASYRENGFLILKGALSMAEVEALRGETLAICRGERGAVRNIEPPAEGETADETIRRFLCIHFPHKISAMMTDALAHPSMVEGLTKVIGPNVKCMQSMLFVKSAGKPGQAWHQDEYYIPTRDRSLTGGWIALDDATVQNGCLWVIPGSHKPGVLWPQKFHGRKEFDCAGESYNWPWTNDDAIPVEVQAGDIVIFNGYLLHRSLKNRAEGGFRRVLVNHYMSAESFLPWHPPKEGDGGMGTLDMRDIVMVAGEDPYAWKPITNIHGPHLRSDGKGGCGHPEENMLPAHDTPQEAARWSAAKADPADAN